MTNGSEVGEIKKREEEEDGFVFLLEDVVPGGRGNENNGILGQGIDVEPGLEEFQERQDARIGIETEQRLIDSGIHGMEGKQDIYDFVVGVAAEMGKRHFMHIGKKDGFDDLVVWVLGELSPVPLVGGSERRRSYVREK